MKGTPVKFNRCGEMVTVMKPTFAENLRYFFAYQLNFMYWRYFMWNFSGRQNDIQGNGEVSNGNWITVFRLLMRLYEVGPQEDMPFDIINNKGITYIICYRFYWYLGASIPSLCRKEGHSGILDHVLLVLYDGYRDRALLEPDAVSTS